MNGGRSYFAQYVVCANWRYRHTTRVPNGAIGPKGLTGAPIGTIGPKGLMCLGRWVGVSKRLRMGRDGRDKMCYVCGDLCMCTHYSIVHM